MKKCDEHAKGKTCIQVIAESNCFGEKCGLFKKVLNFLPKLKNMREFQARGVILTTRWDFSEKAEKKRLLDQKKAKKWLNDFYPRVVRGLQRLNGNSFFKLLGEKDVDN